MLNYPSLTVQDHFSAPCEQTPRDGVGQALRRARSGDPITSHQAAANAALFAGKHCDRIMAALEELGSATAHEIAAATGLTVVQVDRRVCELQRAGRARVLTFGGKPLVRDGFRVWAGC